MCRGYSATRRPLTPWHHTKPDFNTMANWSSILVQKATRNTSSRVARCCNDTAYYRVGSRTFSSGASTSEFLNRVLIFYLFVHFSPWINTLQISYLHHFVHFAMDVHINDIIEARPPWRYSRRRVRFLSRSEVSPSLNSAWASVEFRRKEKKHKKWV